MDKISTYAYSNRGGRKVNEDCCGMYRYGQNLIAIVADGLGGEGNGDIASITALEQLAFCGQSGQMPDSTEIEAYFEKANQEILLHQRQEWKSMKTTAVYLCIHGEKAIWAHIGDSRLYHFHENRLAQVTLDHSASQLAVLMKKIERKDIPLHEGRCCLLKALGVEDIEPEIRSEIRLMPGRHAFLLCTDGFWEYLSDDELAGLLADVQTAREWIERARYLIEQRKQKNSDNNTALAVIVEV